ncbi:DUF3152 domain-containing protein [Actinomycetota bacterium]
MSERTAVWRARAGEAAAAARARRAAAAAGGAKPTAPGSAGEASAGAPAAGATATAADPTAATAGTTATTTTTTTATDGAPLTRAARRHLPSREVRLRRTIVGASVLLLGVGGIAMAVTDDDKAEETKPASSSAAKTSAQSSGKARASAERVIKPAIGPVAPSRPVVTKGSGTFTLLPAKAPAPAKSGRTVTYTVETEGGLGLDTAEFAREVPQILGHRNGWQREDGLRLVYLSPEQAKGRTPDVRVTLASPTTTDKLCAPLTTRGEVSCWNKGRAVINTRRWMEGADAYGQNLARYRTYLISHEVGHGLGHGHEDCPAKGKRAPVMLQQTLGLQGCVAWPYPLGA